MRKLKLFAAGLVTGSLAYLGIVAPTWAADHGDAPTASQDQGADIADIFAFLDPNDNTRVCILCTSRGFIPPGEAQNFGAFDENVEYRINIENTGDERPDSSIVVTFSPRTSASTGQTATVTLPGQGRRRGPQFTAPTVPATLTDTPATRPAFTDPASNVQFFAGIVDDPFFFDIPGFQRFVGSVLAGTPNAAALQRGRDTFAGYNVQGFALSVPRDLIRGDASNNEIGFYFTTSRRTQTPNRRGGVRSTGRFRQLDRMGNPAVNVALIPFPRKDEYNAATPLDDARGAFADSAVAALTALGTDEAHRQILANVAIARGDYLRLNLNTANTGPGGGTNAGAGFPNGRRLRDDTVDVLLTIIGNGDPSQSLSLGDNVNASDVPTLDTFPFFALPHQPRENPPEGELVDDQTRN